MFQGYRAVPAGTCYQTRTEIVCSYPDVDFYVFWSLYV